MELLGNHTSEGVDKKWLRKMHSKWIANSLFLLDNLSKVRSPRVNSLKVEIIRGVMKKSIQFLCRSFAEPIMSCPVSNAHHSPASQVVQLV